LASIDGTSHWVVLVEYLETQAKTSNELVRGKVDYKEVLNEKDFSLYSKLREIRKKLAEDNGLPVYTVCTNEQLAEIAKRRLKTIAECLKIEGIGQGKADKYVPTFLECIKLENKNESPEKKIPSFKDIYSQENLYRAWHKVSLGRSAKSSIIEFYQNLDQNLKSIASDLHNGSYRLGSLNRFLIKDPKERIIAASPVRDRVMQHALMNYYNPIFDRRLTHDSYACRLGKGTHKAVLRAFHFAKSSRYFLKMDVRKYFDSIDHVVLKTLLRRIIKEPTALNLFFLLLIPAKVFLDKGIPIGNLTSQYFANYYLSSFDHYFKERCRAKRYIRYMDDILVFSNDRNEIKKYYEEAVNYAKDKLKLTLKPKVSGKTTNDAPFLGFLVKQSGIFLLLITTKRYKSRIAVIEYNRKQGLIADLEAGRRIESVTAHLLIARSINFRNNILSRRVFGV
jgi:retron-type reverse transcriptase